MLLRAEGLHSCPQMAWSQVRETVADVVSPPDELILFCGMSVGHEDVTVGYTRTGRAPLRSRSNPPIHGRQTGKVHRKYTRWCLCRARVGGEVCAVAPANARRFGT